MTSRTLDHAGAMDHMYRYQRHIYDASRAYYLLGRDQLIAALSPPPLAGILEIGCGTGRNLVAMAERHPGAALYGLDISEEMLKSAGRSVAKAGLERRVRLAQGDATAFDAAAAFGRDQFERIVFSYALSMIPDWRGAIRQAITYLAPNGELHAVDFGQCEELPALFRRGLFAWLHHFNVSPRQDLGSELGAQAALNNLEFAVRPLYRGYAWSAVISKRQGTISGSPSTSD